MVGIQLSDQTICRGPQPPPACPKPWEENLQRWIYGVRSVLGLMLEQQLRGEIR